MNSLKIENLNITINTQSSIKISGDKNIYFDPYVITETTNDADYIFLTHDHYDHFDVSSIENIITEDTVVIMPKSMEERKEELDIKENNLILVEPNMKYNLEEFSFSTVQSYNLDKKYHPKEKNYVGYILEILDTKLYVAGDTDVTEEARNVEADIVFIPIGGTYTMDKVEAASFVNLIKPKIVIPTHYGSIVGKKEDGEDFKNLISSDIDCKLILEN